MKQSRLVRSVRFALLAAVISMPCGATGSGAPAEQRELAVPGSAHGYVGGESHDRYRIAVSKGDRLEIRLRWRRSSGNRAEALVSKSPDLASAESLPGGRWSRDGRTWRGTIGEEGVIYLFVVAHPSASYTVGVRRVDATERSGERNTGR